MTTNGNRRSSSAVQPSRSKRVLKTLGPDSVMGEGDTELVLNILPEELAKDTFELLRKEVKWQTMYHRGASSAHSQSSCDASLQVARFHGSSLCKVKSAKTAGKCCRHWPCAGHAEDNPSSYPIYRHPADASPPLLPFSPTVARIRAHIEQHLNHPVNHVLIQHYRSGHDFISEHSDKTIDVVRGSRIVNVSFGAERLMILRSKREKVAADAAAAAPEAQPASKSPPRTAQRIPLPHNSLFVLGLDTNAKWLHSIRQDKRLDSMKTPEQRFNNGERISLTFRQIGTFLNADETLIWGQGATGKTRAEAKPVINGNRAAAQRLIEAFGDENQRADFAWDAVYGRGFDVLHFKVRLPTLYYVNGSIPSWRVMLALHEKGVAFQGERLKVMSDPKETRQPAFLAINPRGKTPVLVDADAGRTTVNESLAILAYVETYHPERPLLPPLERRADRARALARMQETENLHAAYDALEDAHFGAGLSAADRAVLVRDVERELAFWERYASEGAYIAGADFTLADCAFYPILAYMMHRGFALDRARWPGLAKYVEAVRARPSGCAQKSQPEGWESPKGVNVFAGGKISKH